MGAGPDLCAHGARRDRSRAPVVAERDRGSSDARRASPVGGPRPRGVVDLPGLDCRYNGGLFALALAYLGGMRMGDVKMGGMLGAFLGAYAALAVFVGALVGTLVG